MLEAAIKVIATPLALLNALSGVVGGVWLLLDGNWRLAVFGIAYTAISSFALGLLLLPSVGLQALGATLFSKRRFIAGIILDSLGWIYVALLMTIFSFFVFNYLLSNHQSGSLLPVLFLGYTLAAGPWAYMAQREPQSTGYNSTLAAVFFLEVGLIGVLIMLLIQFDLVVSMWPLIVSMATVLVVQVVVMLTGRKQDIEESEYGQRHREIGG